MSLQPCKWLDAQTDSSWTDDERYKKTKERYTKVVTFICRKPGGCHDKKYCLVNTEYISPLDKKRYGL